MDLEHLNKTQIILLTLLVSFVTSIATGIVTVSLMDQAPPQVEATVNHVIEHTIQQVTPAQPAAVTKAVVIKSEDLAPQSIAAVQKSIIRIVATSAPDLLVARGIIIDPKGVAVTDRGSLDPSAAYEAILPDGTTASVTMHSAATSSSIVLLDLKLATTTTLTAATFADPSKLQLGQAVVRIGGDGADTVAQGLLSALPQSSSEGTPQMLQASASATTPGSVLIDLYGEVIGIATSDSAKVGDSYYSLPGIFGAAAAAANASNAAAAAGAPQSATSNQ